MEYFRFVPPAIIALHTMTAVAMPSPQAVAFTGGVGGPNPFAAPAPAAPIPVAVPAPAPDSPAPAPRVRVGPAPGRGPAPATRFLGFHPASPTQRPPHHQVLPGFGGFLPSVNANSNQGLLNLGAGAGLAGVAAVAGTNCIFGQNCDLSFRPSIGGAIDANGQFVPQLGVTTQVGDGRGGVGTTFTGGLQLDGKSESGIGGFVAGGVNNGNADGIGIGGQTGFGFSQNADGNLDATAQLGANVQAPQLAGVQFNRPGTALGVQPTILGQAAPQLNLLNLFNPPPGRSPARPQQFQQTQPQQFQQQQQPQQFQQQQFQPQQPPQFNPFALFGR